MLWLFINFVQPHFTHCYLTYTFNYRLVEHPMHIPWKACQERISTYQFWSQLESTPTPLLLLPHFQPWNAPYPIPKFTLPFQCLLEDIPSFWRLILRPIKMVRRMFCVVFSLEISNFHWKSTKYYQTRHNIWWGMDASKKICQGACDN